MAADITKVLGRVDLTSKVGDVYDHGAGVEALPDHSFLIAVMVRDPRPGGSGNTWTLERWPIDMSKPIQTFPLESNGNDIGGLTIWKHDNGNYYCTVLLDERDGEGYFHLVAETVGPVM